MSGRGPRVHDRDVLDTIESIGTEPFHGDVWRIVRAGRNPTRGSAAGGRWSPSGEFEVLYTSLERKGAIAEIGHRLSLEPVWPSRLEHELYRMNVRAARVLRLETSELERLDVSVSRYQSYDYVATQAIAAAAQFLGHDAMIVPNARYPARNLVVLLENLDPGTAIEVVSSEMVDWREWRRRT